MQKGNLNEFAAIHEEILSVLLKLRDQDSNLFFELRNGDNDPLLNQGFWFEGNESQLDVSFWRRNDESDAYPSIGFVIQKDRTNYLVLYSSDSSGLEPFEELGSMLGLTEQRYGRLGRYYKTKNYLENLIDFINNEKNIIDSYLAGRSPSLVEFIDEEVFLSSLERIKGLRSSVRQNLISRLIEEDPRNFWWLNAKPKTWDLDSLKPGEEEFYTSQTKTKTSRQSPSAFQGVRRGDLLLGYKSSPSQTVSAVLEITQELGPGPDGRKRIAFKKLVDLVPSVGIKDVQKEQSFPNFRVPQGSLFGIDSQIFYGILEKSQIDPILFLNHKSQAISHSLAPVYKLDDPSGEDKLEISGDVNAFASLIAYKKLNPPLAVGLFGNWGSGKSFFMEKLEERLEHLGTLEKENQLGVYCTEIIHVKFNAWHYSDANLWASLVSNIFERLYDKIDSKKKNASKDIIENELETSKLLLDQLKAEEQRLETEVKAYKERLGVIEKQKTSGQKELIGIKAKDLFTRIIEKDPKLKEGLNALGESLNLDITDDGKLIEIKNDIILSYISIKAISDRFRKFSSIQKFAVLLALGVSGFFMLYPWINPDLMQIGKSMNSLLKWIGPTGTLVAVIFSNIQKIRQQLQTVNYLTQEVEVQKAGEAKIKAQEEGLATEALGKLEDERQELDRKLTMATERHRKAEESVENFSVNRQLADFIRERSRSHDYKKHLGLISLIRNDFERLSELLLESKKEEDIEDEDVKKRRKKYPKIDRIILYIDDLDRCPKDTVVKVLEAVHLILALDLFVVVVGVDARWVSNALSQEYPNLIDLEDQTRNNKGQNHLAGTATSFDYLEKIFQIPFVIRPMNKPATERFLGYLLENQISASAIEPKKYEVSHGSAGTSADDVAKKSLLIPKFSSEESGFHLKQLEITQEELTFMNELAEILGTTPRSVKRFANIYRIIRAHASTPKDSAEAIKTHKALIFLLGIVVGSRSISDEFFSLIGQKSSIVQIIEELESANQKNSQFLRLKRFTEENEETLNRIDYGFLKGNYQRVARFSFRNLSIFD